LRDVKGFGQKTEDNILAGLEQIRAHGDRVLVDAALGVAESLIAGLSGLPEVAEISYAGSLRRMRDTIGDIDLLVASKKPATVMQAFVSLPQVERVLAHGDTKSAVRASGLQVDLRVVERDAWGAAMIYFTGSKAHNIKIRERAVRAGMKLNEYGLFRLEDDRRLAARTEQDVYEVLGLPYIPPTMREDTGEIEAAVAGDLPKVVDEGDLRGDLHTHTNLTDGHATLEEMVTAAAARGYAYYAVTDHAGDFMAMQRTTREKLLDQRARIAKLQRRLPKMRILHGLELNIQPDGAVDYDPEFLSGFDVLVASVHSHFTLSRDEQTKRLCAAIENPNVHVIGHPTGRQIGRRSPIDLDTSAVFEAAARTGTAMEVNSHPDRLDLRDDHVRMARSLGVTLSIDSDAHAVGHLAGIRYGVAAAQRGWAERSCVLNSRTLRQLESFVARKRARQ
ncbi:MAG: PHP domain-containing protein, partial [Actinomycetota bacterium]